MSKFEIEMHYTWSTVQEAEDAFTALELAKEQANVDIYGTDELTYTGSWVNPYREVQELSEADIPTLSLLLVTEATSFYDRLKHDKTLRTPESLSVEYAKNFMRDIPQLYGHMEPLLMIQAGRFVVNYEALTPFGEKVLEAYNGKGKGEKKGSAAADCRS